MPVISLATLKGGTAKTTTALNIGAALKRKGYSVLLIDSDPQANLTYSLGVADDCHRNLYTEYKKEIMGQVSQLREARVETASGLHLIPSTLRLSNAEQELVSKLAREQTLRKRMLRPVAGDYDFIIIDCPPSFGMLTVNALVASDYVLVPLQGEFLPKKGVENFLNELERLKDVLNLEIELAGFVLTKYSSRKKMNEEIKDWLDEQFPGKLFRSFIHTDIRLATAQKLGKDIFSHTPHSTAAMDYTNLAEEFLTVLSSRERAGTLLKPQYNFH